MKLTQPVEKKMRQQTRGFTLTELIVSLSLFVTLSALLVGIFIRGMRAERALSEEVAVNSEMNFALEQMIRDIRSGQIFWADPSGLDFTDRDGAKVRYELRLADGAIWQRLTPPPPVFGTTEERITGEKVEITDVVFRVLHDEQCDPWRVMVRMAMRPRGSSREPEWVQTSISSRILPLDIRIDEDGDGINDFQMCEDRVYGK